MSCYYPYRYNLSATFYLDDDLTKDTYDMIHKQPNISEFLRSLLLDFYSVHGNVHYYCSIPKEDRLEKFFKKGIQKNPHIAQDILEFMGSGLMTKNMDSASTMCAFMDFLNKKYPEEPAPAPAK